MESIKDPELGRERGMGKNIKSMQVLWFVNTTTISYPRRPNYYFDIHEEVDHLYYYHLRYDRRMGINTFQPDDFVLKEVERKPEDSEFKSSIETNDGRVCMLLVLDLKFFLPFSLNFNDPFYVFCHQQKQSLSVFN